MDFSRSNELRARAHELIPGGAHAYAKGDDQFPLRSPGFIVRGDGCRVWDADGNEFIEYGMGLRAVLLGHAYPPVVEAVREQLALGANFNRPAPIELHAAEELLSVVEGLDMVKFTKDGSTANTAAVTLARAATGRDRVAVCGDQPFFSYDGWFIGTTPMNAGIPEAVRELVSTFRYNDIGSLAKIFDVYPGEVACVLLEASRGEEPAAGFLEDVKALCRARGAIFVLDECITGFRWHLGGAQRCYGVVPDLATFGKALGNGFAVSALVGKRELMELGGIRTDRERVFLLSATHGGETHGLAASIAALHVYKNEPVVAHLHELGQRLATGFRELVTAHGLDGFVELEGRACNLGFLARNPAGERSQSFRTLFLQELIAGGVIAPSLAVSYAHGAEEIDKTLEVVDASLAVYRMALDDGGVGRFLEGPPSKRAMRRFA